jgi:hypothetical protein
MKGKRGPRLYGTAHSSSQKSHASSRGKKPKPPAPTSLEAEVPKKLTETQVEERRRILAKEYSNLRRLERRKKALVKDVNADIKLSQEKLDALSEQIDSGTEMLKQRDLFAQDEVAGRPKAGNGKDHVPGRVGDADAKAGLAQVASRAGEKPTDAKDHPEATH